MFRVLDVLTVGPRENSPADCRVLLNTQNPQPRSSPMTKWIRSPTEAEAITTAIPEGQVTHVAQGDISNNQDVDPKRVRPIQMGEFVRKYVSRRLSAHSEGEIAALMTPMRQEEVGLARRSRSLDNLPSPLLLRLDSKVSGNTLSANQSRYTQLLRNDRVECSEDFSKRPASRQQWLA